MAYHVFRDIDRHMGLAIMNSNGHRDHLRKDHGSTRPGFNHTAVATALHAQDFLSERFMNVRPFFPRARHLLSPPTSIATPNDETVGSLVPTSLVTQSGLAPGRLWLSTDGSAALTTPVRMVTWVHGRATHTWTAPHMASAARFTNVEVLMISIPYLADGGHAQNMYTTLLTRRQADQGIIALFCHQLCSCTSTAYHLRSASTLQFDAVNGGTSRNILKR